MSTFLNGVNRLLRTNSIIKGDDDNITTFSDTQHAANIELAQIAIQNELNGLVAERLVPYEKTSASITLTASTRIYALASDFIRFYGTNPSFYDSTDNRRIYMYRGGEDMLRDDDYMYKTTTGTPTWWYWDDTTSKKVGFYLIPDSTYDSRSLSYDYEASVSVSLAADTMPFHNDEEYQTFIQMASQRFKFLLNKQPTGLLNQDATWVSAKTTLVELMTPINPPKYYGRRR